MHRLVAGAAGHLEHQLAMYMPVFDAFMRLFHMFECKDLLDQQTNLSSVNQVSHCV